MKSLKNQKQRGAVLVEYLLLAMGSIAMASAAMAAIQEAQLAMLEQIRMMLLP